MVLQGISEASVVPKTMEKFKKTCKRLSCGHGLQWSGCHKTPWAVTWQDDAPNQEGHA